MSFRSSSPIYLQEWQPLILTIAGLTMLTGVFGAMAVNTMRRVLSFHVISQVGYMVMGLGFAASRDPKLAVFGMSAGILYLVHHMIVKTSLLMAGGAAELEVGSGSLLRSQLTGLSKRRPALAVLFFIAAMSLAGLPPSSGFVSKLSLLQGAVTDRLLAHRHRQPYREYADADEHVAAVAEGILRRTHGTALALTRP